jgi:hypothetical protein
MVTARVPGGHGAKPGGGPAAALLLPAGGRLYCPGSTAARDRRPMSAHDDPAAPVARDPRPEARALAFLRGGRALLER